LTEKHPGALAGIVVLDCGQFLAGPFCGRLLGDMGADVIKVERTKTGDDMRRGGLARVGGEAPQFLIANRNKRSLAIDIRNPEGRELFMRLVERADVVVENYRPGTMERQGLGYQQLSERNPRIVYCSVSGFGQTGPYRDQGGFDLIAQGMSGIMSVTGQSKESTVRVGVSVADLTTAIYAAYGIVCALVERSRTGKGQQVDVALLDSAISLMVWESAVLWSTGKAPEPIGTGSRTSVPYQAFPTADGSITVGAGNQNAWLAACEAIGRRDLAEDPRYATNVDRVKHRTELVEELSRVFRTAPSAHWVERLHAAGCPAGPIYKLDQVYEDPQVKAREMKVVVQHPTAGPVNDIGFPVKLSRTPGEVRLPPPLLGQHTDEVLEGLLGMDSAELARLEQAGVVERGREG
jgi:crotonobetainyl-CoA:carnitine CoA-transferase CaiB-like acyl-CoA transferase